MALDRKQLEELSALIEARYGALREELIREVARARDEQYPALAGEAHDAGEESLAYLVADLDQAEISRDVAELRSLEAARRRIADGNYGLCVDCGADIPPERLRAQPAAARCVACQGRYEKTYKT